MPVVKTITDPQQMIAQLMTWLDAEDDTTDPNNMGDGFDIDPYDDERERGR